MIDEIRDIRTIVFSDDPDARSGSCSANRDLWQLGVGRCISTNGHRFGNRLRFGKLPVD